MNSKLVYSFDYSHDQPPMELKALLGGKGANIAEMASVLKLAVPPGFTISTDACRAYMANGWPEILSSQIAQHLDELEKTIDRKLGDRQDPLLVSVRSGAKFSMPGMMDTVLNLGLNDESVEGLATVTSDKRFALDSYRRLITMFGKIVLNVPGEEFDETFEAAKSKAKVKNDAEIPHELLSQIINDYKLIVQKHAGQTFPQDPLQQLQMAIEAVFKSWNGERAIAYRNREQIPHDLGTAVNVQAMVFGNRDFTSGTGVGFTRDPVTGNKGAYGDFLTNAQGEDVVAGTRVTEPLSALQDRFPNLYNELLNTFDKLESHYKDMCDTEFTIESGQLWMLQTRIGKRSGKAAVKMAVDMCAEPAIAITKAEAIKRVSPDHLEQLMHSRFAEGQQIDPITTGLAASPGAAVGKAVFTSQKAIEWAEQQHSVILVRNETSPDDIGGMLASVGMLTAKGGLVSHAAVVARGWGKPAIVGASEITIKNNTAQIGEQIIREGDIISIDGSSGVVVIGTVELSKVHPPKEFFTILEWADQFARMKVRANADTGADARVARDFGAQGIGLCRTEHMFLVEDRLPVIRKMILASSPEEEAQALEELRVVQREDFKAILKAMDGLPVTIRLLDPPLHEFLPPLQELIVKAATTVLTDDEQKLFEAAKKWHEVNPMLGTRGVRLGVLKPGLYQMQVRALCDAIQEQIEAGEHPKVEIMIPLTVAAEELKLARRWVDETIAGRATVMVGTMIETPRAAICAESLAKIADFFSFGTNDLTQMTFGFSRDDVEGSMMNTYLNKGLLSHNPFESIDEEGVGQLINSAAIAARRTHPKIHLGVCGEHGGDPTSIRFFEKVGLDYISCSPFRVPIARLACAHAALP